MSAFKNWTDEDVARFNAKSSKVETTVDAPAPSDSSAVDDACSLGEEIKGLHEPFIQWLNLHEILYVHANPTKKSTVQKGQFDFVCLRFGSGCAVEMKALANPESGLSDDQKNWREWAERCEVPCLVTNSLAGAIRFVTRELEL